MQTIKIGSRDSRLAVVQAENVIAAIRSAAPESQVQLITMKTTGDKILDKTLDKIGGKGLFVRELDRALHAGQVDFTVHSLKDLPMDTPKDLPIIAVSARADVRDVLVLPQGATQLSPDAPIGCASARRRIQLQRIFPEMCIKPVRGNVQTRLRKLDEGQYGALVLAAAGLLRLGLQDRIHRYFTIEEILPAAGQGVIAVQGRVGTDSHCLDVYHQTEIWSCILAERAFVRELDGGCSSPVAAYAQCQGRTLHLRGMYVNEKETIVRFGEQSGAQEDAVQLGQTLAQRLREGKE